MKLRLLKSLGLMDPLVNHLVIRRERSEYRFPRRHLKFLETPGSSVPVLYFSKAHPPSSTVLVYSHGNSSNLNNIYGFAKRVHEQYGIAVAAYDYSGYGESRKEQTDFEGDIRTVLCWVLELGYPIHRVVLGGFSLGTYSTLMLKGVMPRLLIAPICGITPFFEGEIAQYKGEMFDNVKAAETLGNSRVLMVHSRADRVSIDHSRLLYRAMTKITKPESKTPNVQLIEMYNLTHEETPEFFSIPSDSRSARDEQGVLRVPGARRQGRQAAQVLQPHRRTAWGAGPAQAEAHRDERGGEQGQDRTSTQHEHQLISTIYYDSTLEK